MKKVPEFYRERKVQRMESSFRATLYELFGVIRKLKSKVSSSSCCNGFITNESLHWQSILLEKCIGWTKEANDTSMATYLESMSVIYSDEGPNMIRCACDGFYDDKLDLGRFDVNEKLELSKEYNTVDVCEEWVRCEAPVQTDVANYNKVETEMKQFLDMLNSMLNLLYT